ncbi:MAG: hypothetical protein CML13_06775 [Puniceicoccaceae bacterium]|nr:hypothetical protein [Puniceicoccaceae bacterium]|tara:strand:+ start:11123 stop:11446 length:324 start_codon:yes stop_codon:yes gene_type:complete
MNVCAISGRLASKPISVSEGKTIKFLIKAHYPSKREGSNFGSSLVPCVLFDANDAQQDMLLGEDYKEFKVELVGRIVRSSYENAEGSKVWDTQIIVNPNGILFQRVK